MFMICAESFEQLEKEYEMLKKAVKTNNAYGLGSSVSMEDLTKGYEIMLNINQKKKEEVNEKKYKTMKEYAEWWLTNVGGF